MTRPAYETPVSMYCDKCGNIVNKSLYIYDGIDEERICSICHNKLKRIPKKYFRKRSYSTSLTNWEKRRVRKKLVMTSPNFDQYYFDHREELLAEQSADYSCEYNVYMYCDKCGEIDVQDPLYIFGGVDQEHTCVICKCNRLKRVPKSYFDGEGDHIRCMTEEEIQRVREELVKTSINFDPYYFDNHKQLEQAYLDQQRAISEMMKSNNSSNSKGGGGAKCPFCGSASISSISTVNRAASIGMFGIASGKIGKTRKCNSCGSMW